MDWGSGALATASDTNWCFGAKLDLFICTDHSLSFNKQFWAPLLFENDAWYKTVICPFVILAVFSWMCRKTCAAYIGNMFVVVICLGSLILWVNLKP